MSDSQVKLRVSTDEWPADMPAQEVLWDMRRNGLPKPENVPDAIWCNLQSIGYNHENIVDLMLLGYTKKEIAEKLGLASNAVYRVTTTPTFKTYFRERRFNREEILTKDGIHDLFDRAIDTIAEVMQDPVEKGATRLAASTFIVEQSIGKAKQEMKIESHMLADVIAKVEELQSRPVSELPEYLAKPKDEMDHFLDNFMSGTLSTSSGELDAQQKLEPESE